MTEDLKSTRPEGEQAHPADFADASAPSDRLVIPRPLRIIGYAVTLAVTAYPVYLGIATLQDKRAESLREAAVHKQQLEQETIRQKEQWQRDDATRREADYKKAQQDAEAAVARKEEARLRLQLSRQESQDKIELSKVEIRERERKAASDQAERFGKEFQEQLGRVLDASPRHVASEIAGLNRFFKGTADQRTDNDDLGGQTSERNRKKCIPSFPPSSISDRMPFKSCFVTIRMLLPVCTPLWKQTI
jgi:hypothetical protein